MKCIINKIILAAILITTSFLSHAQCSVAASQYIAANMYNAEKEFMKKATDKYQALAIQKDLIKSINALGNYYDLCENDSTIESRDALIEAMEPYIAEKIKIGKKLNIHWSEWSRHPIN